MSGVYSCHSIGRRWATALVDQENDVWLIDDELVAHHNSSVVRMRAVPPFKSFFSTP